MWPAMAWACALLCALVGHAAAAPSAPTRSDSGYGVSEGSMLRRSSRRLFEEDDGPFVPAGGGDDEDGGGGHGDGDDFHFGDDEDGDGGGNSSFGDEEGGGWTWTTVTETSTTEPGFRRRRTFHITNDLSSGRYVSQSDLYTASDLRTGASDFCSRGRMAFPHQFFNLPSLDVPLDQGDRAFADRRLEEAAGGTPIIDQIFRGATTREQVEEQFVRRVTDPQYLLSKVLVIGVGITTIVFWMFCGCSVYFPFMRCQNCEGDTKPTTKKMSILVFLLLNCGIFYFIASVVDAISHVNIGVSNMMCTAKLGTSEVLEGQGAQLGLLQVLSNLEPLEREFTEQDQFLADVHSALNGSMMEPIDTPVQFALHAVDVLQDMAHMASSTGENFTVVLREKADQIREALNQNTIAAFQAGVPVIDALDNNVPEEFKTDMRQLVGDGAIGLVEVKDTFVNQSHFMIQEFDTIHSTVNGLVFPVIIFVFVSSLIPLTCMCCCGGKALSKFNRIEELQKGIGTKDEASDDSKQEYKSIPDWSRRTWCMGFCWATFAFFNCAIMGMFFLAVSNICITLDHLEEDDIRQWLTVMETTDHDDVEFAAKFMGKCLHRDHAGTAMLLDVLPGKAPYATLAEGLAGGANDAVDSQIGRVTIPLRNGGILPLYPDVPHDIKMQHLYMLRSPSVAAFDNHVDLLDEPLGVNDTALLDNTTTYRCDLFDDAGDAAATTCEECLNPPTSSHTWAWSLGRRLTSCSASCFDGTRVRTVRRTCNSEEFKEYLKDWKKRLEMILTELDAAPVQDIANDLRLTLFDHVDSKVQMLANAVTCQYIHERYEEFLDGLCRQSVMGGYMVALYYEYIGFCVLAVVAFMYLLWRRTIDNLTGIDTKKEQKVTEGDADDDDEQGTQYLLGGPR